MPVFFVTCHVSAPADLYTLSLHDALPIFSNTLPGMSDLQFMLPMYFSEGVHKRRLPLTRFVATTSTNAARILDRKSTRLNSSHSQISYAVFCLKKKNINSRSLTC